MYTLLYVGFTVSPEGGVRVEVPIAILGENVTLTCLAEGGPGNQYQWQRGGENLENETSETLTLTYVNIADGDDYTCITSNSAGSGNATATLYIMPRITEGPMDILTQNGSVVNFTCFAVGFPTPAYSWERLTMDTLDEIFDCDGDSASASGSGIAENGNYVDIENATESVLEFNPVEFGDEGVYRCMAFNQVGAATSETATVTGTYGQMK